jgi:hypothetical protein
MGDKHTLVGAMSILKGGIFAIKAGVDNRGNNYAEGPKNKRNNVTLSDSVIFSQNGIGHFLMIAHLIHH